MRRRKAEDEISLHHFYAIDTSHATFSHVFPAIFDHGDVLSILGHALSIPSRGLSIAFRAALAYHPVVLLDGDAADCGRDAGRQKQPRGKW